jgi:hypothetical protein
LSIFVLFISTRSDESLNGSPRGYIRGSQPYQTSAYP